MEILACGGLKNAKALLSDASAAQHSGDIPSAINDCRLMLDFAQRLRANFFKLETWTANSIESETYPLLQSLYESSGRGREALEVAVRVQENRAERREFSSSFRRLPESSFAHWSRTEWAALLIQTSVLTIWILLPVSLASIVLLWMFRQYFRITHGVLHSLLCLFSDLCPSFLVLAAQFSSWFTRPMIRPITKSCTAPSLPPVTRSSAEPRTLPLRCPAVFTSR
jgi:hypothetical protein